MEEQKEEIKKGIMTRYGIIVVVLMLFAVMIVLSAGHIIFSSEGKEWRQVGEKETVIKDRVILPKRGNIYTCDGKILASTEPTYHIYMDFWAGGMKKDSLLKYVDALSAALAKKFPERSAVQYKKTIMGGWQMREKEETQIAANRAKGVEKRVPKRSRYVKIVPREVSYIDLKEMRTYPFWNQRSNRSGIIAEESAKDRKSVV